MRLAFRFSPFYSHNATTRLSCKSAFSHKSPPSDILNAVVSFGLYAASSVLECLDLGGYVRTLALFMTIPVVAAALILLASTLGLACTSRLTPTSLAETALPPLLKLIFLIYPSVTNVAFDIFYYHRFDSGSWLRADVSIKVGTAEHNDALVLAWLAIGVYPVGLLLLAGVLLLAARRAIMTNRPTALSRSIGFLYREFEPHFFWCFLESRLELPPPCHTHRTVPCPACFLRLILRHVLVGSPRSQVGAGRGQA